MKFCPQCGAQNKDEARFCVDCGADIDNIASAQPKADATPKVIPQTQGQKNKWIAPVLNIIGGLIFYGLSGIGHALYLKLYNRAAIIGALGVMLSAIALIIMCFHDSYALTAITTCIGLGIMIYSAYDAYKCTQAINEGRELPALWGMRPESMSKGKATGIAVIALVILVIAFVAFMSSPTVTDLTSASLADNVMSDDIITDADDTSSSSSDDEGLVVKITYPGEWSASIGDSEDSTLYDGTGDEVIELSDTRYDVVAAAVQKTKASSDKLEVEIIKDGKVLDSDSTTKDYGVATVSATL